MEEDKVVTADAQSFVQTEVQDTIGIITLNDPHRANCLSPDLINEVLAALADFERQAVRVVVLRAYAGARIFSAGHDLKEIHPDGTDPLSYNELFERLLRAFRRNPAPIIAMIEGSVWGGACDLAATCDILVGMPSSTFSITPAKLGIAYNVAGLNHFMGALAVHIFKEMLFTANPLSAEEAYRLGFLNRLVEVNNLEETTMEIAMAIASRAPLEVKLLRLEMQKLTDGLSMKPDDYEEIQGMRRTVYRSDDFKEGVRAFFEKRTPQFQNR